MKAVVVLVLEMAVVQEVLAEDDDVVRALTERISVKQMHESVAALRTEGNAVFFAAMREG